MADLVPHLPLCRLFHLGPPVPLPFLRGHDQVLHSPSCCGWAASRAERLSPRHSQTTPLLSPRHPSPLYTWHRRITFHVPLNALPPSGSFHAGVQARHPGAPGAPAAPAPWLLLGRRRPHTGLPTSPLAASPPRGSHGAGDKDTPSRRGSGPADLACSVPAATGLSASRCPARAWPLHTYRLVHCPRPDAVTSKPRGHAKLLGGRALDTASPHPHRPATSPPSSQCLRPVSLQTASLYLEQTRLTEGGPAAEKLRP